MIAGVISSDMDHPERAEWSDDPARRTDMGFDRVWMNRLLISAVVLGISLPGTGCTLFMDKEALYLRGAEGRADQEEVRRHLGSPLFAQSGNTGETVWVYQRREAEKGGNNIWTITGWWCDEYALTFDKDGILRHWTHQSEKHRDERTLSECVQNGVRRPP
jgi:hypothetical protein